jgi:hypothetical protein
MDKPKRKPGRPRKEVLEAKKKRAVLGRPPGEAARIKEFYARLLSTSGERVINTVLKKAMDDNDKDQVACLKMCMDRLIPVSYFEKEKAAGNRGIVINIQGLNDPVVSGDETIEAEDVEFKD